MPGEDAHQREYVALSDNRLEFIWGSVRASSSLRLGSKPVSTLASWVSGPSGVGVSGHRLTVLATGSRVVVFKDVGLQRIPINDSRI